MIDGNAHVFRLPNAPRSIQHGSTLKDLLDVEAIDCLAHNISKVYSGFDARSFQRAAFTGLAPLSILQRGHHLARVLHQHLPRPYDVAVETLLRSLTPPLTRTDDLGLGVFFYLPHVSFVAAFGLDAESNAG